MTNKIERINRVGALNWYGHSCYVQEIEKSKHATNESADVYIHDAVEMPDGKGQKINYLV